MMDVLGLTFGNMLLNSCKKRDLKQNQIYGSENIDPSKRKRKKLRADRKGYNDEAKEKEGEVYISGAL